MTKSLKIKNSPNLRTASENWPKWVEGTCRRPGKERKLSARARINTLLDKDFLNETGMFARKPQCGSYEVSLRTVFITATAKIDGRKVYI